MIRRAATTGLALAAVAMSALTGCGGGDSATSDAERFCGEAADNADLIVPTALSTDAALDSTLEFYRVMGQLAPLAIATEWNTIVAALETATTVVPGDTESEQRMAKTMYASEPAAYAVTVWLQTNCAVTVPIVTIASHAQIPAGTLPPPGTTAATGSTAVTAVP